MSARQFSPFRLLPALLLAGDFLVLPRGPRGLAILSPRTADPVPLAPLDSLGLGGFVGTATWTARVRVPQQETPRTPREENQEEETPRTPRTPREERQQEETPRTPRTPRENQTAPVATLRADTGNSPAEAFWNGVSLGVRLWPPFEWSLPASAAGYRSTKRSG